MTDTANLGITNLEGSSSQKHVAVNEGWRTLDALSQLGVIDKDLTAPPGAPSDGDTYIVGPAPTGLWAGQADNIAYYGDGAWFFYPPKAGWLAVVNDENEAYRYTGASWIILGSTTGASTEHATLEEELTGLSGASVSTSIVFPTRSIILAASVKVSTAITGATSFLCGRSLGASEFGSLLGIALGSNNIGVIGPTAIYANEPVVLTATGGNFTAGAVKVSLHYIALAGPE